MGKIRLATPVRPICAVCWSQEISLESVLDALMQIFGPIKRSSETLDFTHTRYYELEMGPNLKKRYLAFEDLMDPGDLARSKRLCNELEERFLKEGKRKVNADPGYIEAAKLVLASTKNYSHRIYIGEGIYGDIQLVWREGRFQVNPWTYADYREPQVIDFFSLVRNEYLHDLKGR